jgi:hypothetical protein
MLRVISLRTLEVRINWFGEISGNPGCDVESSDVVQVWRGEGKERIHDGAVQYKAV